MVLKPTHVYRACGIVEEMLPWNLAVQIASLFVARLLVTMEGGPYKRFAEVLSLQ